MVRLAWQEPLELEMPDGTTYAIRPGYRGRGVSVAPLEPREPTTGRPPRHSTVALRHRIEADRRKGKLAQPASYTKWLIGHDPTIGPKRAQQAVYRELRRIQGTSGRPGRKALASTQELRDRLAKDLAKGRLKQAPTYVKWLMQYHPDIEAPAAQQVVYRELARLRFP